MVKEYKDQKGQMEVILPLIVILQMVVDEELTMVEALIQVE